MDQHNSRSSRNLRPDRYAAQQQPAINSEYYHLLAAPLVGMCILQHGRIVYVNHQFARLLGFDTLNQLIDTSLLQRIHPDDRNRFRDLFCGNEPDMDIDLRMVINNGNIIQANLRGYHTTHNNEPAQSVCLTDISAIHALTSYRDKYGTILNEVEDAVAEVDLKGNLTFYTDAACRMWKVSKTEWIGKNYREFMDESWAKVARQAYQNVFKTGTPGENIIYQIIRNDGKRVFVEDTISAIRDRSGAISGFRAVSRDITWRREAERQMAEHRVHLEAVFRSVQDAVITVDHDLKVLEVNPSAESICGFSAQQTKGRYLPQTLNQCSHACCEVLRQTVETHKEIKAFRVDCGFRQRSPQMVSINCAPLKDARDKNMGAVMVIRDITLLRDLEKQLGQRHHFMGIVGKSKRMQDIYLLMEDLAELDTTVLITGESGTGKEMIARALHQSGHRVFKPFVAVNCSALAEGILESELFGHVKGAFTGAVEDKRGRFEAAHGGTILLDEIGDISPLIQLKLLRVLQEKEFERVGDNIPRNADLRVIACTNKDLKQKVRDGEFRQDLYYRLKVVEIQVPSLRDRKEDIPLLVDYFCRAYNKKFPKEIQGVSNEVIERFIEYQWPGNVRELKHVMERAFVLCEENKITMAQLPTEIHEAGTQPIHVMAEDSTRALDEKKSILKALKAAHWNKSKAAKMLGFSRQTLYKKLNTHRIATDADFRI